MYCCAQSRFSISTGKGAAFKALDLNLEKEIVMKIINPRLWDKPMDIAVAADALYICPKKDGIRQGPLVPYAGKDSEGNNLVGDVYFNFLEIAKHPAVVESFANFVHQTLCREELINSFDTICGIPTGGKIFGSALAPIAEKRFVFAEKKPKPLEAGKKQEFEWDLSQCELKEGERVAVAEDVFNNFQNTDYMLSEIGKTGADVVLLVGALNRSPKYESHYVPREGVFAGRKLPVIATIREAYPEYTQDDPAVSADVAAGNIEWKVKDNWPRLRALMSE